MTNVSGKTKNWFDEVCNWFDEHCWHVATSCKAVIGKNCKYCAMSSSQTVCNLNKLFFPGKDSISF